MAVVAVFIFSLCLIPPVIIVYRLIWPKKYKYTQANCPNKGKSPTASLWAISTYRSSMSGSDYDILQTSCTECGYGKLKHYVNGGGLALTEYGTGSQYAVARLNHP